MLKYARQYYVEVEVVKKIFKSVISLFLAVAVTFLFGTVCFAKSGAELYSESFTAQAGENVSIPVYIKNNPGIMGYKIIVTYDKNVFTPVKVTRGTVLTGGMFNDNIDTSKDNEIFVLWSNTSDSFDDGLLFYVEFKTNPDAKGEQSIGIRSSDEDTFNENWHSVTLKSTSATIDFGEEEPVSIIDRIIAVLKAVWTFIINLFN